MTEEEKKYTKTTLISSISKNSKWYSLVSVRPVCYILFSLCKTRIVIFLHRIQSKWISYTLLARLFSEALRSLTLKVNFCIY